MLVDAKNTQSAKGAPPIMEGQGDESIEDIRISLNRIEALLNRGHQLLYGEDEEKEEEAPPKISPTNVSIPVESNSIERNSASLHQHFQFNSRPISQNQSQRRCRSIIQSQQYPSMEAAPQLNGANPQKFRRDSHTTAVTRSNLGTSTRVSQRKSIQGGTESRLASIRRVHRKPPPKHKDDLTSDDEPTNVSLEALKARIHQELEEYRRNGPLMQRRASVQATIKSKAKATAASKPRTRITPQVTTTVTRMRASQRPHSRRSVVNNGVAPPAARTRNIASTKPAVPRQSAIRSRTKPAVPRQSAIRSRTAAKPTASTNAAPAPSAQTQAPAGRVPIWERLYNDASLQENKLREKREEQARAEETVRQPHTNHRRELNTSSLTNSHMAAVSAKNSTTWQPLGIPEKATNGVALYGALSLSGTRPSHSVSPSGSKARAANGVPRPHPAQHASSPLTKKPLSNGVARRRKSSGAATQKLRDDDMGLCPIEEGNGNAPRQEVPEFVRPLDLSRIKK